MLKTTNEIRKHTCEGATTLAAGGPTMASSAELRRGVSMAEDLVRLVASDDEGLSVMVADLTMEG